MTALCLVISMCLIVSEVFVRIVIDDGMEYNLEMWKYARKLKRVAKHSDQGHQHIPDKSAFLMGVNVKINSQGYRNKEISITPPQGVTRIMMLGDSLTFGWGVPSDETVSSRLEDLLNNSRKDKSFEVINTGIGNTNTEMQVASFLDKGVLFSPDIVVLNYFINDAEPIPRPTKNIFMKHSAAYVFFSLRWGSIKRLFFGGKQWFQYYNDLYSNENESWIRAKDAISKLSNYSHSKDIKLIIVNYPELHQLTPYPFDQVTSKLKNVADEHRVQFVDLLPSVKDESESDLWVSQQDQHPNSLACKLIAHAIQKALVKNLPFKGKIYLQDKLINIR